MSIFSKPLSQISPTDLAELLAMQAVENVRLEFKREIPTRDETLKKLSSFANTFGGFIVIGAEADSKDGRLVALPGVDPQSSFKQTIVQWCTEGVSPIVEVDVSDAIPTTSCPGKVCYVVYSPESDLTPHFLNGRKGVWVRTNEFSARFEARLGDEDELEHLAERRRKVRERQGSLVARARRRFETFAERRYNELGRNPRGLTSHFSLCVVPRFPSRLLCSQADLRSILKDVHLEWRQVGFPRASVGFASQHESELVLRPGSAFSLLEANCWGLLFYATELGEENETYQGIHVNRFVGNLLVFLRHAREMMKRLGYHGQLMYEVRLQRILGEKWIDFVGPNPAVDGPASELDDEVTFSIFTSSDELFDRTDAVARDLLRFLFFSTNWPERAQDDRCLVEAIRRGYTFNMWDGVAPLKL